MNLIYAEAIRIKHTFLAWYPLAGAVFGLLSVGTSTLVSGQGFQSAPYSWMVVYTTGLAAPTVALAASLTQRREHQARSGAIQYRPIPKPLIAGIQLAGISALMLGFLLSAFAIIRFAGAPSSAWLAAFVSWIGSLSYLVLFNPIAQRYGMPLTIISAFAWGIIGTLTAEKPWWFLSAPAWPVRAVTPTLGVHANGLPLEPTNPLLNESPAPAILLCLLFTAVLALVAVMPVEERAASKSELRKTKKTRTVVSDFKFELTPRGQRRNPRKLSLGAIFLGMRSTGAYPLCLAAVCALFAARMLYSPGFAEGFYTFAILPVGCALLPTISWRTHQTLWPLLVTENPHLRAGFLAWHAIVVAFMCAFATLVTSATLGTCLLWILTGIVLCFVSLALTVAYSPGPALAFTLTWVVYSAVIGGDALATTWLVTFALPAWPHVATPGTFKLMLLCTAFLALCAAGLMFAAYRRRKQRSL